MSEPYFSAGFVKRDYEYNMEHFHSHNYYELYLQLSGKRTVYIANSESDTYTNDVLLIKPEIPHRSVGSVPHEGIGICFDELFLDMYFTAEAKKMLTACFEKSIVSLPKSSADEICVIFDDLCENDEMNFACLAGILRIVNNNNTGDKSGFSSTERTDPIKDYINKNFAVISGLDDIADAMHITKSYLSHRFKNDTGRTVTDYLNKVRTDKACDLLQSSDKTISEISEIIGYDTQTYFSLMFKKYMGVSPMEFRARINNENYIIKKV